MDKLTYQAFDETVYHQKIQGRLACYFIPKKDYAKSYVTLTAPLGSVHRSVELEGNVLTLPAGTAHFLEHKVFEKDGEDLSRFFALHDANINAFTSAHQTTYLFSATNHLFENIQALTSMFFHPHFTEAGIEKEKGIILEELNMHNDDPYYLQYYALLGSLFHQHPIKEEILGSTQSIQSFSMKELQMAHQAFYAPEMATLVIVGEHEPEHLFETLEKIVTLGLLSQAKPHDDVFEEPTYVVRRDFSIDADIHTPNVLFGVKLPLVEGSKEVIILNQLRQSIVLDLAFGLSSKTYEDWLDTGLINDSYGLETAFDPQTAHALVGSESHDPEGFMASLWSHLETLEMHLNETDFKRVHQQMIGTFIQSLDSLEYVAHQFTRYILDGINLYELLALAQTITFASLLPVAKAMKEPQRWAYVWMTPRHSNKK